MSFIRRPIFAINFKAYDNAIGKKAIKLSKKIDKASKNFKGSVILIVSNTDLFGISSRVSNVYVFSEHIDPFLPGAHTGKILAEDVKDMGAHGVLINHAEDRVSINNIRKCILRAKKNGLKTIVCAENIKKLESIVKLETKPDMVAIEPPELIGGNVSVTNAKPNTLKRALDIARRYDTVILCGAGIKTKHDVISAMKIGLDGILVASAIAKSKTPIRAFKRLAKGFKEFKD